MHEAIIVGAGLFGQIIAAALRAQGRDVVVIDSREREAGSGPAACLMKPSWFSSMGREVFEPSLRLLDELYGVHDIRFVTQPKLAHATVHWCDPAAVLAPSSIAGSVTKIERAGDRWHVTARLLRDIKVLEAPLIVVAAGIWTEKLLPQYKQVGQKGVAFLWPDMKIKQPFVQPWAPYRQLVAFNRGDGLWVGDGTAIKQENWTEDRLLQSYQRCGAAVDRLGMGDLDNGKTRPLAGVRPYAKDHKPCLLEEAKPGLWVASGGAKNGTMAAGYCAHTIRERTS